MQKNHKYLLLAAGFVVVGILLVDKWLHSLPKPVNPDFAQEKPQIADRNKKLSKGSRGLEVGLLQNKLGGLMIDGIFGDKTEARLKEVKGVTSISLGEFDN